MFFSIAVSTCLINTVFNLGLFGLCCHNNSFLRMLLCLELLLTCVSLNFLLFSIYLNTSSGIVYFLCILAISAGEVAVGLGIAIYCFLITKSLIL